MPENAEKIQLGAGLIQAKNVRDDFAFAFEITEAPVMTKRLVEFKDRETGEPRSFNEYNLVWTGTQRYPEPREQGRTRDIQFRIGEEQAKAIEAGIAPRMTPRSPLGALTEQSDKAGLPSPDSADIQGHVVLIQSYSVPRRNGNGSDRRYDVISDLGTRKSFNPEQAKELIDELNNGERGAQEETSSF
jgi:hypothetical protein